MASIFFDTCAIETLIKKINGKQLKATLLERGSCAVVGRNTLYECAKNLNNTADISEKYSFIEELEPEYTLTSQQYYQLEIQELNNKIPFVRSWAENGEKEFIKEANLNIKNGVIDSGVTQYHKNRSEDIKYLRNHWKPNNPVYTSELQKEKIKSIKKFPFEEQLKCLIEYNCNKSGIKRWLKEKMDLSVNDEDLEKILNCLINKSHHYKALQSCIRTNIYLAIHSFFERKEPRRDRFEDALQLTEAAYCTTFVSAEKKLVAENDFGRKINPLIELLDVETFLKHASLAN